MATASRTFSTPPSSSALSPCSSIVKEVCLCDWWLIKADPNFNSRQLSVGGINSEKRIGIRVFHSAPILKRYNNFTLETADGITVTICGTINRLRTLRNGFTQQVCNHFVIGFPYYWEEFANQLFSEESTEGALPRVLSNLTGVVAPLDSLSTFSSGSLDDLPGALLRDFSLSTLEDSANCEIMKSMFGDILEKHGKRENDYNKSDQELTRNSIDEDSPIKGKKHAAWQNNKSDHEVTGNFIDEDTPVKGKKSAFEQNHKDEDDLSTTETRRKKFQKTAIKKKIRFESNALRNGPLTRSMAQLRSKDKKDENVNAPNETYKDLVTGKIISSTTPVTRRLNLRNRSVNLNIKSIE